MGEKLNHRIKKRLCTEKELLLILSGKAKKGIYHIQHINSYHSNLKKFMRKFNGISTKYLNNYLIWNNILNYSKETWTEKKNIFTDFVFTTNKTILCKDIWKTGLPHYKQKSDFLAPSHGCVIQNRAIMRYTLFVV